jgi:hypothetical protein
MESVVVGLVIIMQFKKFPTIMRNLLIQHDDLLDPAGCKAFAAFARNTSSAMTDSLERCGLSLVNNGMKDMFKLCIQLSQIARGSPGGKVWSDGFVPGTSILEHYKNTLAKIKSQAIQALVNRVASLKATVESDADKFYKIFPALPISPKDLEANCDMQKVQEALASAALTKCETLICLALESRNPKRHVLACTSEYSAKFFVRWQDMVHPELVNLVQPAAAAAVAVLMDKAV